MSNYNSLKATIDANVKTNGNEEITGSVMNSVLNSMVNTLGAGWIYKGIAFPTDDPGDPDTNVFYIASQAGTYTNFGGLVVRDGKLTILKYNGSWVKDEVNGIGGADEFIKVTENGFYVVDEQLNIGFQVDRNGAKGLGIVQYTIE